MRRLIGKIKSAATAFYRWTGTYCEHGRRLGCGPLAAVDRYHCCPDCRAEIERAWATVDEDKRAAEVRKMADAVKIALRELDRGTVLKPTPAMEGNSEMTPKQKRASIVRLAKEVMGWEVTRTADEEAAAIRGKGFPYLSVSSPFNICVSSFGCHRQWRPFDSIADAFMLVDMLAQRNRSLRFVAYAYNRTFATFLSDSELRSLPGPQYGDGYIEANGKHATPEAITLAALQACGLERRDANVNLSPTSLHCEGGPANA
jgi:hypothetical protein